MVMDTGWPTSFTDSLMDQYGEYLDVVKSQYHAMVLQVNKRYTRGLLFNANYTLARAKDSGQNSTTMTVEGYEDAILVMLKKIRWTWVGRIRRTG